MVKEPTQTNRRNRPSVGYDNGEEVETSKRETKHTSRSFAIDPTLSVDPDLDAANVCDKKTSMERLELVKEGLGKLLA